MKTVIEMAREAGFTEGELAFMGDNFLRFAELVADAEAKRIHDDGMVTVGHMREQIAAEREACAKVCEDNATDLSDGDWDSACINCADHIRARSNT